MKGSLAGIRVLELGQIITAPYAGMMLADLGADIVKVENPEGGDPFRAFRGGRYSAHFVAYNRNKRSMTLNLRAPRGLAVAEKLIARSDVLLENFRPDVMARLGLCAETLSRLNPRLIHASITGFGADGPYAERPAFDTVGMALSGMASLLLDPDEPQVRGPTIVDNVSGLYAAYGILAALRERDRTGIGSRVEVSMLEAAMAFMPDPFSNFHQGGMAQGPYSRSSASQSYAFRCADGKLLAIHLSSPEKFWLNLLDGIGRQELAKDERFLDRMKRVAHYQVLRETLAPTFAQHDRAYWIARLANVDVPFAPVNSIDEVEHDPQIRHLGTFFEIEHPTEGHQRGIHRPVRIDGERGPVTRAAPVLGEHTREVLEELGYDGAAFEGLREAGVV